MLHSICQQIWKTQQQLQDWKRSVFIPILEKAKPKNVQTTIQLYSFHMLLSKVMIKILLARLQQYMNQEIPDVQAGFRKGRGSRDRIVGICWITEKAREFQKKKKIYFYFIDTKNLWLCGSQQTVGNSSRDKNTRPPYLPPEKLVHRSRRNS